MNYRLFYTIHHLTPAAMEKVRKERSEGAGECPEIQYKRKRVVEDREFESEEDIQAWVDSQKEPMPDYDDVLQKFVVLWGAVPATEGEKMTELESAFAATQEDLL